MPAVKKVIFTTTGNFYPVTWEGNGGQRPEWTQKLAWRKAENNGKNQRV